MTVVNFKLDSNGFYERRRANQLQGGECWSVRQTPHINAATDRQDLKGIWRLGQRGLKEVDSDGEGGAGESSIGNTQRAGCQY